jgi:hypothetical protein
VAYTHKIAFIPFLKLDTSKFQAGDQLMMRMVSKNGNRQQLGVLGSECIAEA